jgi:phospholipid/cholesterol/gamma-HCH transport system substrate-binding protein
MQSSRTLEIWVGLFTVLGLFALFVLAMRVSNLSDFREPPSYDLTAYFHNIGGLKVKAPVTIAGVRVGRVAAISFDEKSFNARVTLAIESKYDELPEDSSAAILTSGLLGEQYIGLEPGGSPDHLRAGQRIEYTQSALVLENIIGQFLYSKAAGE